MLQSLIGTKQIQSDAAKAAIATCETAGFDRCVESVKSFCQEKYHLQRYHLSIPSHLSEVMYQ